MLATKTLIKIIINTLIGAILIFVWLKFVNIGEVIATISKVDLITLLPVFLFLFISPSLRALRLKIFLAPIKKISLSDMVFLNGVATMLNFFIPIRGGEIAKGIYLNTQYQIPLRNALIWVLLDRFIDFLTVLILAAVLLLLIPTKLPFSVVEILVGGVLASLFLSYLLIYRPILTRKIFNFLKPILIFKVVKKIFTNLVEFFLESFLILKRHPKDLSLLFIISVLAYASEAAIWYFTFSAIGFTQDYFKMYLGQLLSALTYLIPAAPGYIGSAEASGVLVFSGVFGLDTNLSSGMIVLFHFCTAIFIIIFGLFSLYTLKMNLSSILKVILKDKKVV